MGPYLVGMFTGYLLYRTRCNIRMSKYFNFLGWGVATGVSMAVLYGLYDDMNGERLSTEMSALYNTVHRTVWGACVAWVIFSCATGYGDRNWSSQIWARSFHFFYMDKARNSYGSNQIFVKTMRRQSNLTLIQLIERTFVESFTIIKADVKH
ncbi:hypothetical protein AM593_07192, partial [Mytilus galloprovincialis]